MERAMFYFCISVLSKVVYYDLTIMVSNTYTVLTMCLELFEHFANTNSVKSLTDPGGSQHKNYEQINVQNVFELCKAFTSDKGPGLSN